MSRKRNQLDRQQALRARPTRQQAIRVTPRDNGGALVTISIKRPGWQRWLGGSETFEKSYGLDSFGKEVYDACDGKTSVQTIIKQFVKKHNLSRAEAELAVTAFLKTLLQRSLVSMQVNTLSKKKH